MILITGSTGNLGKATISHLLTKTEAKNIAALARDEEKAAELKSKGVNVRIGDYKNPESLLRAFSDVEKLLLISSSELGDRAIQHINVIEAAKKAGVKHIVFTSFQRTNETAGAALSFIANDYLKTEKHLKASGIAYTIFKNGFYMDMVPELIGSNVIETGGIYLPAGNGKVSFVLRDNIAEALANVLTSGDHKNKVYEISPDKAYSFADIALILAKISGKQIEYVKISVDDYKAALKKYQVPETIISMLASFMIAFSMDEMNVPGNDLNKLLEHPATKMEDYLKKVFGQGKK